MKKQKKCGKKFPHYNQPLDKQMKKHSPCCMLLCLIAVLCSFYLIDSLLFSCYKVSSNSMEPSIMTGKRVFVNKTLMGARISFLHFGKSLDFVFRLRGLRKIVPNDVICFNYPHVNDNLSTIKYSYEVYCKRVLGCPGDRIGAVDGHCWNDRRLRPIGVVSEQEKLRWMFDGFFKMTNSFDVIPFTDSGWNIKNWGPIIVPAKGLTVALDDLTRELYRQVIEYETSKQLEESTTEYTFQGDYYFAVGDNSMSSFDSRYWGFIPEHFIIGIVTVKNSE